MPPRPRHQTPDYIERGDAQTLTFPVFDSGVEQTATSGTLTVTHGSTTVLDAVAVTAGAPASYTLSSSAFTDYPLSDRLLEVWVLTIGGVEYTFQRRAHLVRRRFYPTVDSDDLVDLYPWLTEFLSDDKTSFEVELNKADQHIQRKLLRKGRRPELIFDVYDLAGAFEHYALHLIFRWGYTALGGEAYKENAEHHLDAFEREWRDVAFSNDDGLTGTVDDGDRDPSSGPLTFTAGRGRRSYGGW